MANPRLTLTPQLIVANGGAVLTMVAADAADGMKFVNNGRTELVIENGDAADKTVTITSVPCSHGRLGDVVVTATAGKTTIIGPLDPSLFNQTSGADMGSVYFSISDATSVTVGARCS
jgi:hypothetical protein